MHSWAAAAALAARACSHIFYHSKQAVEGICNPSIGYHSGNDLPWDNRSADDQPEIFELCGVATLTSTITNTVPALPVIGTKIGSCRYTAPVYGGRNQ